MSQISENSAIGTLTSYAGAKLATRIRLAGSGSGSDRGLGSISQQASPSGTVVTTVGPPGITNAYGEVWTITATAKIAVNGVVDMLTANVIELAYVTGLVWQLNTSGDWYSKPQASAPWSAATRISPLPSVANLVGTGRCSDAGTANLTTVPAVTHPFSNEFSTQFDSQ